MRQAVLDLLSWPCWKKTRTATSVSLKMVPGAHFSFQPIREPLAIPSVQSVVSSEPHHHLVALLVFRVEEGRVEESIVEEGRKEKGGVESSRVK